MSTHTTNPFAATLTPAPALAALPAQARALLSGQASPWRRLFDGAGHFAINLLIAIIILLITLWLSRLAARVVGRAVGRMSRRYAADPTLPNFLASLARWGVVVVGAAAVLEQLGVHTTSILAVLGAASLAIGLALQGALANVAAGVMLLLLRPYRIGDFVEINGKMGTVKGLDLFGTQLSDPDNLSVFMPNGKVFGEMIVNYSRPQYRRMELNFNIDYADDLDLALGLLLDCAKADPRVRAKPEPWSRVTALTDQAVTVTLRAWAGTGDYWDTRYDMIKRVKQTFEARGLSFPYPRQVSVNDIKQAVPGPAQEASGDRA